MAGRNQDAQYTRMPNAEVIALMKVFEKRFHHFLRLKDFPANVEVEISVFDLVDIINRVDKRKAYYAYFHTMKINEFKEAALYAYWILKLRPFKITDVRFRDKPEICNLNEAFAIYLIGAILYFTKRLIPNAYGKQSYYKLLEYSFRFRSFTIDSLIVLVESMNTETFCQQYPDLGYYNQLTAVRFNHSNPSKRG
jgi:hypothetical protein